MKRFSKTALCRGNTMRRRGSTALIAVVVTTSVWLAAHAVAQVQLQIARPATPAAQPTTGGASVETATDAIGLIERANNDLEDGQIESAVRRLMYAAERFGASLLELESGVMVPTARYVDHVVGGWAKDRPEALEAYRRIADAEVLGILGGPVEQTRDPAKLEQVMHRYMLSSMGDEAAYMLACHWIDNGRFAEAATLLQRLQRVYPDPTVSQREIAIREALAHGRSGAIAKRDEVLGRLKKMGVNQRTLELLEAEGRRFGDPGRVVDGWPMTGGRPDGLGVMPPLDQSSKEMPQELWAVLWENRVEAGLGKLKSSLQASIHRNFVLMTGDSAMLRRWREHMWRPTFQLASNGNQVCYVVAGELHCIDAQTGRPIWKAISGATDRVQRNDNLQIRYSSTQGSTDSHPMGIDEVFAFGDRVMSDLTIVDQTVYFLQPRYGFDSSGIIQMTVNNGRVMVRDLYQANKLVAVDLSTGKPRWQKPVPSKHDAEGGGNTPRTRIVVAPMPAGDLLLTVAEDDGDLYLAGMRKDNGEVVYRRFLCSAGDGFAPGWARVGLAVDGQAAFVATNRGLVFAVDANTGNIRWASRYARKELDQQRRGFGYVTDWTGEREWDDARVIPAGGHLLVTASDAPGVMVFDRFNGEMSHRITRLGGIEMSEMAYVAGATPEMIIFGGAEGLLAASMDELVDTRFKKRWLVWHAPMPEGTVGRPAATRDRLYVPTRGGVVELERQTGRRLNVMAVSEEMEEPLGNLFVTDGQLFAGAGGRLAALGNARLQIERLSKAAEAGDLDALAARAQLLAQIGQTDLALRDLRREFQLRNQPEGKADAGSRLIAMLIDRSMSVPAESDKLLAEAMKVAQNESQRLRVRLARAEAYVASDRKDEAITLYHELAMADPVAPLTIGGEDAAWEVRPDVIGRQRLMALLREGSDERTRDQLERLGRPELDAVLAAAGEPGGSDAVQDRLMRLQRIAAVHPGTSVAGEAIVALGVMLEDDAWFALGESSLRELAAEQPPRTAALADAALAKAYEQRMWALAAKTGYLRAWSNLTAIEKASGEAPADGPVEGAGGGAAADAAAQREATNGEQPVGVAQAEPGDADGARADAAADAEADAVAEAEAQGGAVDPERSLLASLPSAETMKQRGLAVASKIASPVDKPPFKKAWEVKKNQAQLLSFDGRAPGSVYGVFANNAVLFDGGWSTVQEDGNPGASIVDYGWRARHALVYVPGSEKLTAYNARSGEIVWVAPLPPDVESQTSRYGYLRNFSGGFDGHLLVMTTPSRSFAIDLVTGKRLWTEDRQKITTSQNNRYYASSRYDGFRRGGRTASVAAGVIAEAVDNDSGEGELVVRDARTGQPRWRRSFSGRQFDGLEIIDGQRVGVMLDNSMRAMVFDLQTGGRISAFDTADTRSSSTWRMWTRHGLLTQDSNQRVLIQPLEPGEDQWKYEPRSHSIIRSWQRIGDDRLLILWHNRRLTLLNLKTRKPDFEISGGNLAQNMFDAAVSPDGKRLLVAGNEGSEMTLTLMDATDGKVLQKTKAGRLVNYMTANVALFRRTGRLMPLMVTQGNNRNKFELQVFDTRTGKGLVKDSPTFEAPIDAPDLRDGVVILTTREGIYAIGGEQTAEEGEPSSRNDDQGDEQMPEQARAQADSEPRTEPQAPGQGVSIISRDGQVVVKTGQKEVRIKVNNGARVQVRDGKLVVNGRVIPLKAADGDAAAAKAEAAAQAAAQKKAKQ